jgi:hypothetical protein
MAQQLHGPHRSWSKVLSAAAVLVSACSSGGTGGNAPVGIWGSSQGSLNVADSSAHLVVAAGQCYGAFADINGVIPIGSINLSGTFTQLTGVAPGSVQYPATFSGTATASNITLTILLTTQGQQIGPISVALGVSRVWTACLYP